MVTDKTSKPVAVVTGAAQGLGRAVARGVLTPDAAEVLAGPICPLHNRPIILRDGDHAWCRVCMQVELEADE